MPIFASGNSQSVSGLLQAPARILHSQLRRGAWHILVRWTGLADAEATWAKVDAFRAAYPNFQLEDELSPEGGRDVMVVQVYRRSLSPATSRRSHYL